MPPAEEHWLCPDWPAPAHIRAGTIYRHEDRKRLRRELALPGEPVWLRQAHGTRILVNPVPAGRPQEADGSVTEEPGVVCAVLTADCVPVLMSDAAGTRVAAIHAGWRGIARGIIGQAVSLFAGRGPLLAWLGPHICARHYTVGEDMKNACLERLGPAAEAAFREIETGVFEADLALLIKQSLSGLPRLRLYEAECCNYEDARRFHSHRRDGGAAGRMASLIWMTGKNP